MTRNAHPGTPRTSIVWCAIRIRTPPMSDESYSISETGRYRVHHPSSVQDSLDCDCNVSQGPTNLHDVLSTCIPPAVRFVFPSCLIKSSASPALDNCFHPRLNLQSVVLLWFGHVMRMISSYCSSSHPPRAVIRSAWQ
jgi:hypothetical protein